MLKCLRFSLVTVALVAAVLESGMNFSYIIKLTLYSHEFSLNYYKLLVKQYTYLFTFRNRACVYVMRSTDVICESKCEQFGVSDWAKIRQTRKTTRIGKMIYIYTQQNYIMYM